ncbi:MAG: three-Cys-motif partner protein TcmP [Muribaculaceae bacterium]|nr:three-Cys-motif partner protein TcmP [Muribaculaceae bacterium]
MAKKVDVKNTMQIHSKAKVEFYKTYLERYIAILCQSKHIRHIRLYDVFCGMGIYDDGGKGSPIVAYDTIKDVHEAHKITNNTEITLIVNDKSKTRIARVKEYIASNKHSYCSVRPYNLDIDQLLEIIIPEINNTQTDTRNLVFIDPYGYKDIKKELLLDLMKNGLTEIILFLPISHMQRFTNVAVQDEESIIQYEPLRDFVYSFFPDTNHPIRQSTVRVGAYIHYVAEALKFNNKFFATSYTIERDKVNHFALFFMSSNIFGFEKILETKWTLDEEHGAGFKLPKATGDLFAEEFAIEAKNDNANRLKLILEDALKIPRTNTEIYEIVLRNEFLPKHANEVLRDLQQNNPHFSVTNIADGKTARKNSFYLSHKYYRESPVVKMQIVL